MTTICAQVEVKERPTSVPPEADFSASPTSGKPPLSVQFTDLSTNANSWTWNFGDGKVSTLQSPWHTYKKAGTYTVSLKVTNPYGSSTMIKQGYIVVKRKWF